MIGNGARICVNQKEEGYIVSRLRKRLQSLIDLARKAKACHSRRKLAASARISRSGCFLNRVFVLKSCSWLKVFSAANGLECIRGCLSAKICRFWRPLIAVSDKAALTRRVVGIYLLFTLLAAVIFESLLYLFAPADLPPLIIRLGSIVWGVIVVVLAGGVLALLSNKEVRDWLGGLPKFVEASFVTRKVRRVVIISSIVTALLYPLYQVIASPSRTAIPNTSYSGTMVVNDPLTSNNLGWDAVPSQPNGCIFTAAGYEVRVDRKSTLQDCFANKTNFSDFALQVQMTLMAGDVGGILFRDSYVLNLTSGSPQGSVDLEALPPDGQPTYLIPACLPLQVVRIWTNIV